MRKILAAILLLTLPACSMMTMMSEKPQVEVVGVSVKEMNLTGGVIEVSCNIKNPNNNSIKLDSIGYNMSINDNSIANGEMKDGIDLRAKEEKTVGIPIQFSYADVAMGIGSIFKKQKFDYHFTGSAKVGIFTIPFSKKGQIDTKKRL